MRRLNGEKLRDLRESSGIDQAAFVAKVREVAAGRGIVTGLTQPMLSRYENGGQRPTYRNLQAIAAALGVEPNELLVDEARREEQEASEDEDEEDDLMAPLTRALEDYSRLKKMERQLYKIIGGGVLAA